MIRLRYIEVIKSLESKAVNIIEAPVLAFADLDHIADRERVAVISGWVVGVAKEKHSVKPVSKHLATIDLMIVFSLYPSMLQSVFMVHKAVFGIIFNLKYPNFHLRGFLYFKPSCRPFRELLLIRNTNKVAAVKLFLQAVCKELPEHLFITEFGLAPESTCCKEILHHRIAKL